MIHLNIASLQKHIDELRSFLSLLNHPFDVICITETRLYEQKPLANISIDGYEFVHTPTKTQCGGTAIFTKTGIEYEIINNLTSSLENISESVFDNYIIIVIWNTNWSNMHVEYVNLWKI